MVRLVKLIIFKKYKNIRLPLKKQWQKDGKNCSALLPVLTDNRHITGNGNFFRSSWIIGYILFYFVTNEKKNA